MRGSKNCGAFTHGILCSRKKRKFLPFATVWMDPESIIKGNKTVGERQMSYDLIHRGNLMNKIK